MTRIFTDGAEFGDILFWSSTVNLTVDGTAKRTGNYSYKNSTSYCAKAFNPLQEFYARMGIYINALPNAIGNQSLFNWRIGGTRLGTLILDPATAFVKAYTGDLATLVDIGTISIRTLTWYLLDIHIKIDDSPNGVIQVKVDGVSDIDFSGDTKPGSDTTVDNIGSYAVNTSFPVWWDDIALNDTAGGSDNSWCGDGKIILQTPNAAGDVTGLTPSAGSNYQCVDEFPNDGDTTYVVDSIVDDYDLYNLTPCGLTNVDILRVFTEARARDVNAVGGLCKLGVKTEATEYWDSSDRSLLTTYYPVIGTQHTVNPNTSAAWTTTQLDALQAGFKVR